MAPQPLRILHTGAVGQRQQRGDGHHQPVPFRPPRRQAASAVPVPACALEDAEALLHPHPQTIELQRHRGRGLIREQEPGLLLVGPPHGHQGAAALAAVAQGGADLHSALAGLGHPGRHWSPRTRLTLEGDAPLVAHVHMPALPTDGLPQPGTGQAAVTQGRHLHAAGDGRSQPRQQAAVGLGPTARRLLGGHHLPGHGQRTAPRPKGPRHAHGQAGHTVPQRGGIQGQHQFGTLPQAEDPAQQRPKATAHLDRRATVPALAGGSVAQPHAQPPMVGHFTGQDAEDGMQAGAARPHRAHHPKSQPCAL